MKQQHHFLVQPLMLPLTLQLKKCIQPLKISSSLSFFFFLNFERTVNKLYVIIKQCHKKLLVVCFRETEAFLVVTDCSCLQHLAVRHNPAWLHSRLVDVNCCSLPFEIQTLTCKFYFRLIILIFFQDQVESHTSFYFLYEKFGDFALPCREVKNSTLGGPKHNCFTESTAFLVHFASETQVQQPAQTQLGSL